MSNAIEYPMNEYLIETWEALDYNLFFDFYERIYGRVASKEGLLSCHNLGKASSIFNPTKDVKLDDIAEFELHFSVKVPDSLKAAWLRWGSWKNFTGFSDLLHPTEVVKGIKYIDDEAKSFDLLVSEEKAWSRGKEITSKDIAPFIAPFDRTASYETEIYGIFRGNKFSEYKDWIGSFSTYDLIESSYPDFVFLLADYLLEFLKVIYDDKQLDLRLGHVWFERFQKELYADYPEFWQIIRFCFHAASYNKNLEYKIRQNFDALGGLTF